MRGISFVLALLGALAVGNAQNTCAGLRGITRDACTGQGNDCEWCERYDYKWGFGKDYGTKCSNSVGAGACSSHWVAGSRHPACSGSVCQESRGWTASALGYCCEGPGRLIINGNTRTCGTPQQCSPSPPPPVDCAGGWGSWGSCSASCGGGTQSRTYTVTRAAAHGGSSCPHSNGHQESRGCNPQACPVLSDPPARAYVISGSSHDDLNGRYEALAAECNGKPVYQKGGSGGTVLFQPTGRSNWMVGSSAALPSSGSSESCAYVGWINSALGGGVCAASPDGAGCAGRFWEWPPTAPGWEAAPSIAMEAAPSEPPPPPPPVNCAGSWSSYGSCSASCGGGTQSRTYTITRAAAHGGSSCAHSNRQTESRACNEQRCAPDLYDADALEFGDDGGSDGGGSKAWILAAGPWIILLIMAAVAGLIRARCRAPPPPSSELQAKAGNTLVASTTTTYVPPEMAAAVADAEGK
eukprot:COSAG04_NODE_2414_length_4173_cov_3.250859_2_plen_468_part_00